MASEAQIQANRLNAQKSTGPRTAEGKAAVAQNAVKHGLLAEQAVIKGEDPGEFEFYREQMLGELAPAGALESILAERAVGLAWRLRRAERIQTQVFDAMLDRDAANPVRKLLQSMRGRNDEPSADAPDDELALGRAVVRDFSNARVLDRLGLYERRIEHSLYKTLDELEKLRLLRELQTPTSAEPTPEPHRPPADGQLCETKPISPRFNTEIADPGRSPTADKDRSCLTEGRLSGYHPAFRRADERPFGVSGPGDMCDLNSTIKETAQTGVFACSQGLDRKGLPER
jgi:hypothetical protein